MGLLGTPTEVWSQGVLSRARSLTQPFHAQMRAEAAETMARGNQLSTLPNLGATHEGVLSHPMTRRPDGPRGVLAYGMSASLTKRSQGRLVSANWTTDSTTRPDTDAGSDLWLEMLCTWARKAWNALCGWAEAPASHRSLQLRRRFDAACSPFLTPSFTRQSTPPPTASKVACKPPSGEPMATGAGDGPAKRCCFTLGDSTSIRGPCSTQSPEAPNF